MYFLDATLTLKLFIETKSPADWGWEKKINDMIKNIINEDIINGSFVIPDGVTKIGDCAFYDCTSLSNIIIPESITEIGDHAFAFCTRLGRVIIPESVTKIRARVFYGCSSLKSIIIPESVIEIGEGAFERCRNLKKISLSKKVKLGLYTFFGCHPDLKIEYRD